MNFINNLIKKINKPKVFIIDSKKVIDSQGRQIYYYYCNKEEIGYIRYKMTGQIGLLYLEPEYRGYGIGKKIVENAIDDMKQNNIEKVWLVSVPEHKFWKQMGFTWYSGEINPPSVTGSGFFKNIK